MYAMLSSPVQVSIPIEENVVQIGPCWNNFWGEYLSLVSFANNMVEKLEQLQITHG
jgi:hypothetical protein